MSSQLLSPKPDLHWGPSQCRLPATYSLEDLVGDIKAYLGTSSGLDSSDVDPDYLISLVQKYISEPADWLRFFHNDPSKNYTRNAIENINHKANILLLVWNPQKGSPVHDHANAHCIMKVLAGELRETVYHAPDSSSQCAGNPLQIKSATTHQPNAVSYISDDIGLHRVHNPSRNQLAVSLHCKFALCSSFGCLLTGLASVHPAQRG